MGVDDDTDDRTDTEPGSNSKPENATANEGSREASDDSYRGATAGPSYISADTTPKVETGLVGEEHPRTVAPSVADEVTDRVR